jgi:hypothetical protein
VIPTVTWQFRGTIVEGGQIPIRTLVHQGARCLEGLYRVANHGKSTVEVNGVLLGAGETLDLSSVGGVRLRAVPNRDAQGAVLATRFTAEGTLDLLHVCCCCGGEAPSTPSPPTTSSSG